MDSRLADEGRKALIANARRLSREERLQAFVRHSKLVIELYNAARRGARARELDVDANQSER
jgi:hypothetical protein